MKKFLGRIIEGIGYLALFATYILFYLSKKKMGVQRDFIFRNKKWMDLFFTGFPKYLFIAGVALGIIYLSIYIIKRRRQYSVRQFCHSLVIVFVGISFLLLILASSVIKFAGVPMLLVSLLFIIAGGIISVSWREIR